MIIINKQNILIVDDSEMNRMILSEILGEEYNIVEAADGAQAVGILNSHGFEISLVLLDIVMPKIDGFQVLRIMNKEHWIESIPVIMISANDSSSHIDYAYKLGVSDFIGRPFDSSIVRHRVNNTMMLYAKQKKLADLVIYQIYEKQKKSSLMINILSHVVETYNGESGLHVLHIQTITEILLRKLMDMTDEYGLSQSDITMISDASALHDIGKLAVPQEILNKPGRFTDEEFAIMKTHSMEGAKMLDELPFYQDEPFVKTAYEICRWHHERYDGRGYPDGLKGDDIPISAQVVAIADVYDALTSERCYKKAFSHEKAIDMILHGECGAFKPQLLECLLGCAEEIREQMALDHLGSHKQSETDDKNALLSQVSMETAQKEKEHRMIAEEMVDAGEHSRSERLYDQLENERKKYAFYVNTDSGMTFEYSSDPPIVIMTEKSMERLGIEDTEEDPMQRGLRITAPKQEQLGEMAERLRASSPEQPVVRYFTTLIIDGERKPVEFICHSMWSNGDTPECTGVIGRIVELDKK